MVSNLVWIGRSMCSRPQYTGLTYMGGTGSCKPMRIIFGAVIKSQSASLSIKFGANETFHVPKIRVFLFGFYGRYQILWIDIALFQHRLIEAYWQSVRFVALCVRMKSWIPTDRQTDMAQMRWSNVSKETKVNIAMPPTRIDKTKTPSLRRV